MKYLLDTNALIGLLFNPSFLSETAETVLQGSDSLSASIVSLWEIGIKQSIGKIDIRANITDIADACRQLDITIIPILPVEIDNIKQLPLIHRDPFDRLLISQAMVRDLIIVTKDSCIPQYPGVKVLW